MLFGYCPMTLKSLPKLQHFHFPIGLPGIAVLFSSVAGQLALASILDFEALYPLKGPCHLALRPLYYTVIVSTWPRNLVIQRILIASLLRLAASWSIWSLILWRARAPLGCLWMAPSIGLWSSRCWKAFEHLHFASSHHIVYCFGSFLWLLGWPFLIRQSERRTEFGGQVLTDLTAHAHRSCSRSGTSASARIRLSDAECSFHRC